MSRIVSKGRKTWKDGAVMTYTITDDGVLTISGKLAKDDNISIRSNAPFRHLVIEDGIPYIGHHNFAFWKEIEVLTLPPSVKVIGVEAFSNCTHLKQIHFSEGLTTIHKEAFYKCKALEKFTFPESLETISMGAFFWCSALKRITIPKKVKCIAFQAFAGCHSLTRVTLNNGLDSIEGKAFQWCDALRSVNFPKTISYIGEHAFEDCDDLKNVILPEKVRIGYNAFGPDDCSSVTGEDGNEYIARISNIKTNKVDVSIGPPYEASFKGDIIIPGTVEYERKTFNITTIEESAFLEFDELTSVRLPDTIEIIDDTAFQDCKNLKSIYLGKSLERIGMSAFHGCSNLREITFPDTLRTLGCRALEYTPVYEEKKGAVYLGHVLCGYNGYLPPHSCLEVREGTTVIAERAFTEVRNLEAVIFPDTIKSIGYCAFVECLDLKYIKLPKSLEYIGADAFSYTQVKEIIAPWRKPIRIDYTPFPASAIIHIPKGSMAAYSEAEYWNKYKLVEKQ
jgi:hypothetical protein